MMNTSLKKQNLKLSRIKGSYPLQLSTRATKDIASEGIVQGLLATIMFKASGTKFVLKIVIELSEEILAYSLAIFLFAKLLNACRVNVF
jgi:hypothetical protein